MKKILYITTFCLFAYSPICAQRDTVWLHVYGNSFKKGETFYIHSAKGREVIAEFGKTKPSVDTFIVIDTSVIRPFTQFSWRINSIYKGRWHYYCYSFLYDPQRRHIHLIYRVCDKKPMFQFYYLPGKDKYELYIECGTEE